MNLKLAALCLLALTLTACSAAQTVTKFSDSTDTDAAFLSVQTPAGNRLPQQQVAVGMTVQDGSAYQANGQGIYVENKSQSINAVGNYVQTICSNGGNCWGSNPLVESRGDKPSVLVGTEVNVNSNNSGDQVIGISLAGNSDKTPAWSFGQVLYPLGVDKKIPWKYGYVFNRGAAETAIVIQPGNVKPTSDTAPILFIAYKNGQPIYGALYMNSDGQLCFNGKCF